MLDFTLHGWDVVEALGLKNPILVGHSMGGMIAAEMAALAPNDVSRLALICPAGLWLDDHPIVDIFSLLPFEMPKLPVPRSGGRRGDDDGRARRSSDPKFLQDLSGPQRPPARHGRQAAVPDARARASPSGSTASRPRR